MTFTTLVGFLLLFIFLAIFFVFFHLMLGKLIRPAKMDSEKGTIYECGEPSIGSAWIQFDLRFYVIALLFVVFDVEVAFFFPWAVVFGNANAVADADAFIGKDEVPIRKVEAFNAMIPAGPGYYYPTVKARNEAAEGQVAKPEVKASAKSLAWVAFFDILVFFGVLLVGFAYLWKRGDLVWVRSTAAEDTANATETIVPRPTSQVPAGAAS